MVVDHQTLRSVIDYNPDTGVFRWKIKAKTTIQAGDEAGWLHDTGHLIITFKGKDYRASRLAWFYMTGRWPKNTVDHKDRNPLNNKWKNLRPATRSQQQMNRASTRDGGMKGVTYMPPRPRPWLARIKVNSKQIYLGYFKTEAAAHAAYRSASRLHHGEFACLE